MQQGDLILQEVSELSAGAVPVEMNRRPDGGIDLGGGYTLVPGESGRSLLLNTEGEPRDE